MREILTHLNIEVPDSDTRTADEIADAILSVIGGASALELLDGLKIVCPMAEEI